MAVGVEVDLVQRRHARAGQRIEFLQAFHLVAEQGHAPGAVLVMAWENIDALAAQAERAALKGDIVATVLQLDQRLRQQVTVDLAAALQLHRHARIGLDRADAVDAGDRGDDDDVVALQQRPRRGVAHAVDLLVDLRVLLDIRVGARNVGFRLVVVVI